MGREPRGRGAISCASTPARHSIRLTYREGMRRNRTGKKILSCWTATRTPSEIGTPARVRNCLRRPPTVARLLRCQRSPNCRGGAFDNPVPTVKTLPGTMGWTLPHQLWGKEQREPPRRSRSSAPTARCTRSHRHPASGPPDLATRRCCSRSTVSRFSPTRCGPRASRFRRACPKRFRPPPLAIELLPPPDIVLLSHDGHDHLDMNAGSRCQLSASSSAYRSSTAHLWRASPSRSIVPRARIP